MPRVARTWAEQEARRGGQGRSKALARMVEHGLPRELAVSMLDEVWDHDVEREHALALLARWLPGGDIELRLANLISKQRAGLMRKLASRGFDPGLIRELLGR